MSLILAYMTVKWWSWRLSWHVTHVAVYARATWEDQIETKKRDKRPYRVFFPKSLLPQQVLFPTESSSPKWRPRICEGCCCLGIGLQFSLYFQIRWILPQIRWIITFFNTPNWNLIEKGNIHRIWGRNHRIWRQSEYRNSRPEHQQPLEILGSQFREEGSTGKTQWEEYSIWSFILLFWFQFGHLSCFLVSISSYHVAPAHTAKWVACQLSRQDHHLTTMYANINGVSNRHDGKDHFVKSLIDKAPKLSENKMRDQKYILA